MYSHTFPEKTKKNQEKTLNLSNRYTLWEIKHLLGKLRYKTIMRKEEISLDKNKKKGNIIQKQYTYLH